MQLRGALSGLIRCSQGCQTRQGWRSVSSVTTGVVRQDGTFDQINVAKSLDSDASWTDRHGPVEEAGPAPAARRIGNRFPPPPLFLHEPGRFEGTQVDSSRLDGCQQTLDVERVRPQTARRQSVTETRSNGFDSRRLHRYRALQSVPHSTRWQEITQSARADLDWPTTRPHEWDTRTSASQIRCSTSAATRTRISPSSNSPRSRQRWVRHQVLSQESASTSLSPLGERAALVSELVDIHVRNRG